MTARPGRGSLGRFKLRQRRQRTQAIASDVKVSERRAMTPDTANPARTGSGAASARGSDGLSERDLAVLAFERQWWKYAGAKEQAVRELFDMSATRYYQVLNGLIDRPDALAADPMLVKRLRRLRASRQRARSARRLGFEA
jgi:Protein of unknown function (DUF3263)